MNSSKYYILLVCVMFSMIKPALSQTPSSNELIQQLNPNNSGFHTRGLMRNLSPEVRTENTSVEIQPKPSVDLMIQFEFNSSKILEESKPILKNLAIAMNSPELKDIVFSVEGHTDSVGTDVYNQRLSSLRASSVVHYLATLGVASKRLNAIGKGSTELLNSNQPESAENRRVRIKVQ